VCLCKYPDVAAAAAAAQVARAVRMVGRKVFL